MSLRVSVTATITAKMSPVKKRETPAAISPILQPRSDSEEEADIVEKQNNTCSSLYLYIVNISHRHEHECSCSLTITVITSINI